MSQQHFLATIMQGYGVPDGMVGMNEASGNAQALQAMHAQPVSCDRRPSDRAIRRSDHMMGDIPGLAHAYPISSSSVSTCGPGTSSRSMVSAIGGRRHDLPGPPYRLDQDLAVVLGGEEERGSMISRAPPAMPAERENRMRFLATENDRQVLIQAVRRARQIMASAPIAEDHRT